MDIQANSKLLKTKKHWPKEDSQGKKHKEDSTCYNYKREIVKNKEKNKIKHK